MSDLLNSGAISVHHENRFTVIERDVLSHR